LDTRLSVQDYEDAKVTEEGEGTNDAMASDWGWVLILYILITVEMNVCFEIVEVQVATGFAQKWRIYKELMGLRFCLWQSR
jgi:hypothetical protein